MTIKDVLQSTYNVAMGGLLVVGVVGISVSVCAIAPLVSLVAVPIFALKALYQWVEHRPLYNKTLTNGSREKFGRINGQDYTQWNGKTVTQITVPTSQEIMHESIGEYYHGQKDKVFMSGDIVDSVFNTQDDLDWLTQELVQREKKDLLDNHLKMLRAYLKALIPILGVFWVCSSEINTIGGASQIGCYVCLRGGFSSDTLSEDAHWSYRRAIEFHKGVLEKRLKAKNAREMT